MKIKKFVLTYKPMWTGFKDGEGDLIHSWDCSWRFNGRYSCNGNTPQQALKFALNSSARMIQMEKERRRPS